MVLVESLCLLSSSILVEDPKMQLGSVTSTTQLVSRIWPLWLWGGGGGGGGHCQTPDRTRGRTSLEFTMWETKVLGVCPRSHVCCQRRWNLLSTRLTRASPLYDGDGRGGIGLLGVRGRTVVWENLVHLFHHLHGLQARERSSYVLFSIGLFSRSCLLGTLRNPSSLHSSLEEVWYHENGSGRTSARSWPVRCCEGFQEPGIPRARRWGGAWEAEDEQSACVYCQRAWRRTRSGLLPWNRGELWH